MGIVGFMISSMDAKRPEAFNARVKIQNNVNLKNVEAASFNLGGAKQDGLKMSFVYKSGYGEGDNAYIQLEGHVLYMVPQKESEAIMAEWKKSSALPRVLATSVVEQILQRCTVQAIMISRDMGLPAPISLPKVASGAAQKKKK